MATVARQTVKDVSETTVKHHRGFLEEHIDPDTGLLDVLFGNGTLSNREFQHIKHCATFIDRNSKLLDYILAEHHCDRLLMALRGTEQIHVVNYLNENGEYKPEIGGDWPLTEKEVSILITNHGSLVDLLECDELLGLLLSSKVIIRRQMASISSEPNPYKRNEALLECLQRRSLRDYFQTIKCLHQTKQSHIAEILKEGGVVVRIHANLDGENVTETENEISTAIANMIINDRSAEESNRILELVNLKVIAAKTGQSIVLYIYCKTIKELQQLHKSLTSGRLKDSVELLFNRLLTRSQEITVAFLITSTEEYLKMQTYFKEEEIRRQVPSEGHSGYFQVTEQHSESKVPVTDCIQVRAIADFDPKEMSFKEEYELERLSELQRGRREAIESVDLFEFKHAFKRGDKMKTIPPANICDSVGWWMVRHLNSGKIGFMPRNRVVIDLAAEDQPVKTTIDQLPLDLLDIILQNSLLHYALSRKQPTDKRDEFLVKRLSSVDFCWFQRLRRHRFKKTIWRHLSKFYRKLYRGLAIFMSNRSYLEENIQPKVLISRLRSNDCLTDVETRLLGRQTLIQSTKNLFRGNNNPDLLHVMRSFDDAKFPDFIECLKKSNQELIVGVAGIGGVLLKAIILNQDTAKRQSLVQTINDLRDKTKPRPHQMEKLINQLKDDNIEILNSLLDRQTVIWIWCQSQTGLEKIKKLNESNSLIDVFTGFTTTPSSSAEITKLKTISICRDLFKRCVVAADPYPTLSSLTNDEIRNRIKNIYAEFVCGVEPDRLSDYLVREDVITPDQLQRIRNDHPTTQDRCRALLYHLFSIRHPTAFLVVRQALVQENHYLIEYIDNQESVLQGELRYLSDPVLVDLIRTNSTGNAIFELNQSIVELQSKSNPLFQEIITAFAERKEKKEISGLTILDKELFVVSGESSEVEVYDSVNFSFSRRWNLKELIDPTDVGSCNRNECLYIFDCKGSYGGSKEILRVDPNGTLIKKWSTGDDIGYGLSVTDESNVILAVTNKHTLNEYSPDGQLIREINLSSDAGIRYPLHAIKLTNGHFVVCHRVFGDDLHTVTVVDVYGKFKKSFGGKRGSTIGQLSLPYYLIVDGNGFVMVADSGNNRVLLLNSDLEFKREILSKEKHGLRRPVKILLDESYGRLFVHDYRRTITIFQIL